MKLARDVRLQLLLVGLGMGLQSCGSNSGQSAPAPAPVVTATQPANTVLCNNTSSTAAAVPCPLYTVSPEVYGAKGDGTTDDSKAIQSAIAATSAAGGGVVALRAVTYYAPGGLALAAGVHLRGLGCDFNGSPFGVYVSGTRLLGNNTNPGVYYLPAQFSSQPAEPAALAE